MTGLRKNIQEINSKFVGIEAVGGAMAGDRAKDWSKDKIPTDQDIQLTKGSSKRK